MKKTFSVIILALLALCALTLVLNIQPVNAGGTIYIRSNGNVDPPTAPIQRNGDLYTLTANIYTDTNGIVIERNNMTLDGASYKVQGTGSAKGIDISSRHNVTIKNMKIKAFNYGIYLFASLNNSITKTEVTNNNHGVILSDTSNYNSISENNVTANNWNGVYLEYSSDNSITGNNVTANNQDGIELFAGASNNCITGNNMTANSNCGISIRDSSNNKLRNNRMVNNIYNFFVDGVILTDFINDVDTSNTVDGKPIYYWTNQADMTVPLEAGYVALANCTRITIQNLKLTKNGQGILLAYTTDATIAENNITGNLKGARLRQSSNNKFYYNNFVNNTQHVIISPYGSTNFWDDGYPSGGNYWSNYTGIDLYSGPYQNESRKDGLGDSPHVIDANSQDRYPLMTAYRQPTTLFVPTRYITIQEAVNTANPGDEIFVYSETYYENVVVNKTVKLIGESKESTIINGNNSEETLKITADNITITGFTIKQPAEPHYKGLHLTSVSNCLITNNIVENNLVGILLDAASDYNTIANNDVRNNTHDGIYLHTSSSNNLVIQNSVTENGLYGIVLRELSNNNSITQNNITENFAGIVINSSSYNIIRQNIVSNNNIDPNAKGLWLNYYSSENRILKNNVEKNSIGIDMWSLLGHDNVIYHNNFVNNTVQVYNNSMNIWDDGYPSGGNYWNDYNGTDLCSGPYQNETGNDGIGDIPYFIDASNQDNYPLMDPWTNIAVTSVSSSKIVVGQGYSLFINVKAENQGYNAVTFNVTVCANTTLIEAKQITLSSVSSSVVSFIWNTTNFVKGNYTIRAMADTVLGEMNISDNTMNSWVIVSMHGDFDGDFDIDIDDIRYFCRQYINYWSGKSYDDRCDFGQDNDIDIDDVRFFVRQYIEYWKTGNP